MQQQRFVPYMFLAPFLLMFGVFWLWPIGTSVYYSFTRWDGMSPPHFVGAANYSMLASNEAFYSAVANTLAAWLSYEVLLVVLATVLAFLLNATFLKGRALFQAAILAPITVAMAIVALMFQLLYDREFGFLNQALRALGVSSTPDWLGDERLALSSIVILRVWRATGYYTLMILAGLQSIPRELLDAARIDGASEVQAARNVTLPLLRPILGFVVITSSIWALQLFEEPWILTSGGPGNATLTVVMYLYLTSFRYFKLGAGAAVAVVLTMLILVFALMQMRYLVREQA
jgi:ABC-type sugar transport system permease subunit